MTALIAQICGIINMPAMFSHPGNDQTVLEA